MYPLRSLNVPQFGNPCCRTTDIIQTSKTCFNYGVGWCDIMWPKNTLFFIEGGVKINQQVYLAILKDEVLPWVKKTIENSGVTLQQDGATSHTGLRAGVSILWFFDQRSFGPLPHQI